MSCCPKGCTHRNVLVLFLIPNTIPNIHNLKDEVVNFSSQCVEVPVHDWLIPGQKQQGGRACRGQSCSPHGAQEADNLREELGKGRETLLGHTAVTRLF